MKTPVKTKPTRAAKRDLFAELGEGMTALAEARQGKRTLRTHAIEYKPAPKVTPKQLIRGKNRDRFIFQQIESVPGFIDPQLTRLVA